MPITKPLVLDEEPDELGRYHISPSDFPDHAHAIDVDGEIAIAAFVRDACNAFILAGNELNCCPGVLANRLVAYLGFIAKALVLGREGLQNVRDFVEDQGIKWPEHTWDNEQGIPGYAIKSLITAIGFFPGEIHIESDEEKIHNLIREMRDYIEEHSGDDATAQALIKTAEIVAG